jgi:apolipoprotein N-acyltransferase
MNQGLGKWGIATAAAVVSALAMGAAQTWTGCATLVFLALIPLCLALRNRNYLQSWLLLALFNGIHTALTAQWIRQTAAGFEWFLALAVVYEMALAAIPAAGCWVAARRRSPWSIVFLPASWMLMEMLSRHLFFGVSWALIGLPLADIPALSQAASLGGPEFLSFLVIAINVALSEALRPGSNRERWVAVAQASVLAAAMPAFGMGSVHGVSNDAAERIGVVQPMLSQQTRWDRLENRPPMLARLNGLIDHVAAKSPSMIVLPEGALPGLVYHEKDLAEFATGAVRRTLTPLLFGTVDRDEQGQYYNAAVGIGTDSTVKNYRKRRLVPFAEHTPWPFHYNPPDGWVRFAPGTEATQMRVNVTASVGVMLCLEDIYPDMGREYAEGGSNLLIAMVNTETFKDSNQVLTHLRRARLTAIAAGLPMLRVANSGVSCSMDAHGRIIAMLPPNREAAEVLPVSLSTTATLYGAFGDFGVLLFLLGGTAVVAAVLHLAQNGSKRVQVHDGSLAGVHHTGTLVRRSSRS